MWYLPVGRNNVGFVWDLHYDYPGNMQYQVTKEEQSSSQLAVHLISSSSTDWDHWNCWDVHSAGYSGGNSLRVL